MSDSDQISISPLCPQCDSENIVETDEDSENPILCKECGFKTTLEYVMECNENHIQNKLNEHVEQLVEDHLIKPLNKTFK